MNKSGVGELKFEVFWDLK